MCLSPVKIRNPNYASKVDIICKTTDTINQWLYVPCNVCSECLMSRQMNIVQRARVLSLDYYMFFCTLTYNNESLPSVTTSTGVTIRYADISDVQKMFKRIRSSRVIQRDFLYYFVSERGSSKGRPHFHGLIFIKKDEKDDYSYPSVVESKLWHLLFSQWKRNYGSDRSPVWKPLFTYRKKFRFGRIYTNFDCHYCVTHSTDKGTDDVAFYVTKYLLKPSDKERRLQQALRLNLSEEEFEQIWKIVRSRSFSSKGFGMRTELHSDYIRSCAERSCCDSDGLKFFNPSDGMSSPISRYYRKKLPPELVIKSVESIGGPQTESNRDIGSVLSSLRVGERIIKQASKRDISEFYPE